MTIAVDFDGTCVTHEFPEVGRDIGAAPVLRKLVEAGHHIILYTMRSRENKDNKDYLQPAIDWFNDNNIPLFGVNENPTQSTWTKSPKVYADLYIDDAALGCPLKYSDLSLRPHADWEEISRRLCL